MKNNRLIVFFIPAQKVITGGIISIFSICEVSRESSDIHHAEVVLCVYPGDKSYEKNDWFKNNEKIYSFDELIKKVPHPEYMMMHVPDYASEEVFNKLLPYRKFLESIPELRINLLNQNVLLMPKPILAAKWFQLTPYITQTTAHDRYSTQKLADEYGFPCHHMSAFVDASQYHYRPFNQKEKIILLSKDRADRREKIVAELSKAFKDYKIIVVENLTYEDYKELMSRAKFAVTFGESFDGYYVEAFFTGGLTFAVYNDVYFPDKEFGQFENTYSSYEDMLKNIVKDMRRFEKDKELYEKTSQKNLDKINQLYKYESYKKRVRAFYDKKYTYMPKKYSIERLIGVLLEDKAHNDKDLMHRIETLDEIVINRERELKDTVINLENNVKLMESITNSISWKVTKPLRKANSIKSKRF